jgi:lipopolysaccharide biosynthesis regulator YciM
VKNWSRLKRWTRTGNWGDAEYLRLAYDATAERHLHSGNDSSANSEFERLWQSAAELSEDVPERELTLARLATKWQLMNQAEELWVRVEENPTMRREALDNLRQLYRAKDETTKLHEVLQRLHESSPNEAPITADLARLGLNLGQNTERSHQLAREAYDRAPNEVDCALTYAFSLHRLGRNAEALAIIQSLPPEQLHDPHQAVYVAQVLVEGNELEGAKEYIAAAENGKLHLEEKKLLEEAKTKLIAASAIPSPTEPPPPNGTPPL